MSSLSSSSSSLLSSFINNISKKLLYFIDNTFLIHNSSWRVGVTVGVGTSILLNSLYNWKCNLSFMINISYQLERILFTFITPPNLIKEEDSFRINLFRKFFTLLPTRSSCCMKSTDDILIPSPEGHKIPATVFTPLSQVCGEVKRPIIVHIHGGGFVIGDVPMHAPICTTLAAETGFIVVSIEYRLAPEHKCPAAHNDCMTAMKWIHDNAASLGGDEGRICVIGDSAGGNLAACVSCEFPDIVSLCIPVYPVIKFGQCSQSKVENYNMPVLPACMMEWFSCRYFNSEEDMINPLVCPLKRTREELSRVPRTHVITAQYDVLRDEGILYAKVLREVGVNVTHENYDNTVHGFYGNAGITHGTKALMDTARLIKEHFS